MSSPSIPEVPTAPVATSTEVASEQISEQQKKARKAQQQALGRASTVLSAGGINAVTGESTSSLLGGDAGSLLGG